MEMARMYIIVSLPGKVNARDEEALNIGLA